ncbi:MAG: DNA-binding response regulator [Chitinophagia bacterium]|nr:DNA-binding response regulator [Chitinophagia bacterium]
MRFLLVDDHSITLQGLEMVLKHEYVDAQFSSCINAKEAINYFSKEDYDLVILDVNMPETNIHTLIDYMLAKKPTQLIMMFSMNPDTVYAKRFLRVGVKGFVNKENPPSELLAAVRTILSGGMYLSHRLVQKMSDDFLLSRTENPFDKLSQREMEVCSFLVKGYSLADIADIMQLHKSTIGTHRSRIMEKIGVKKIFELREMAIQYHIPIHT